MTLGERDFDTMHSGSIVVLFPLNSMAEEWCNEHLPEDCPLWGRNGYAIETNFFEPIREGILSDGFIV